MSITIGGRSVCQYTDAELVAWLNEGRSTPGDYRLRKQTAALWLAILRVFDEGGTPQTVRQMYYALVTRGAIPKTEAAYNQTCYHLLQMRRRGPIPYDFIADSTRWMRKPKTYTGLEAFLEYGQEAYRRALWADQADYVEIWCEKDALAGVLYGVTERWDVPLMVTRGFPSETFVYTAAETLKSKTKPVYLYYFGDYDPSGVSITETTRDKLRGFGARFEFEAVAVLPWQVVAWSLPTRPTKRSDSRAKNWVGGSVELDAIPVSKLRELAESVIKRHIDGFALEATRRAEREERRVFDQVMQNFKLAQDCENQEGIGWLTS